MKVNRAKITKKGRDLMDQNSAKDDRGYMIPPPNRPDLSRVITNQPTIDYKVFN